MVKSKLDIIGMISAVIGFLVAIAVGGLFVNGTFLGVVILEWLPLLAHQIVGWTIIGLTVAGAAMALFKKLS